MAITNMPLNAIVSAIPREYENPLRHCEDTCLVCTSRHGLTLRLSSPEATSLSSLCHFEPYDNEMISLLEHYGQPWC
jgi:hypothetical protein